LMGGLLIALSGYTISIWKGTTALTNKDLAGIFGCLYLLGILIYVINNLMTYKYFEAGSQPETLINSAYFDDEIPRNKMLLLLYLNEIEEYDRRISSNNTLNHQRWRRYKITVFLFLFFPFVLVLLYGALEWFRRGK
ncbi:MAG TPA: hypothetical protein VGS79_21300, partial [Puia sp.]|nr:hypothetical protein [Puia sp.]